MLVKVVDNSGRKHVVNIAHIVEIVKHPLKDDVFEVELSTGNCIFINSNEARVVIRTIENTLARLSNLVAKERKGK